MNGSESGLWSFCRKCGGERRHSLLAEEPRPWGEKDVPIDGNDTWSIVECLGCSNITFIHSHWFSEDSEMTPDGPVPIVHRDLYPPAPTRKPPEWGIDFMLGLSLDDQWVVKLREDIYAAVGIGAYTLAAMGTRTIVDFVVTSKAAGTGKFEPFDQKLGKLKAAGLISDTQVSIVSAAFDAGSAAAHRGYSPSLEDVYLLLDVAESLLDQLYVEPARQRRRSVEAAALKSRTPPRPKPTGP